MVRDVRFSRPCPVAPSVRVVKCEVRPGLWLLVAFDGSYVAFGVTIGPAAVSLSDDVIALALHQSYERFCLFLTGDLPKFPPGWVVAGLGEFLEGAKLDLRAPSSVVH